MTPRFFSLLLLVSISVCLMNSLVAKVTEFNVPIGFSNKSEMFLRFRDVRFLLDRNDQLTMKDSDCIATVDLAPPNAKEKASKKVYRQLTQICISWFRKSDEEEKA
uniref:Uncharacterized protein n=1 Tax=Trichobilharzia regenti TaxID=157069 RepID=A0AA85J943_TRIRE|nr:unnamed protein product [Trichobilharzia regenti]